MLECWESDEGLNFLDTANNRTILPYELIIDLDDEPTIEQVKQICKRIDELYRFQYKIYHTGSKGYHIHINIPQLLKINPEERRTMRKAFISKIQGADMLKNSERVMIALENAPHWKTGKPKKEIQL